MEEESVYVSGEKRNAIVTGANKGIGLEICRQLACNGILVILTARDEKRGKEAAEDLNLSGLSGVVYHQLDVKDPASISSLVDFVKARFGKLDILVNNAAESGVTVDLEASKFLNQVEHGEVELEQEEAMYAHGILQQTYEGAVECLKTNYFGCKHVTQALVPLLQQSRSPRIVNVSSFYGQLKNISNEKTREQLSDLNQLTEERVEEQLDKFIKDFKEGLLDAHGWPTATAAYRVSKAALNAYTRILAKRFPSFCVNCVHPGYAKTDMNPAGYIKAEEGARAPVMLAMLAMLPDGGPSGLYFDQMEVSVF